MKTYSVESLGELILKINQRKSYVRSIINTKRKSVIDVFHGEMYFQMYTITKKKLLKLTQDVLNQTVNLSENNGSLYSKYQPIILRILAVEKLFHRFKKAGLNIDISEVLVCPYSSLVMIEAAIATIAKPNGLILCPTGFYKSNALHIEKFGLRLQVFPADIERDARIDPNHLRRAIQQYRANLCGILLTIPGNPFVAEYSYRELQAIGQVILEEGVKVIVDSAFDSIQPDYIPLAAVKLDDRNQSHPLYNQIVTITGISKTYHAPGPFKIGAAVTGNEAWFNLIKRQLVVSFQRETTAFARLILEETPDSYIKSNRLTMMQRQQEAKQKCQDINAIFGSNALTYMGSSNYGPFMILRFRDDILDRAGIEDGWQLADFLLATVGLDVLAGPRMGLPCPAVRININAPRIGNTKDPALFDEVFHRLGQLINQIIHEGLTYIAALEHIGVETPIGVSTWQQNRLSCIRPIERF